MTIMMRMMVMMRRMMVMMTSRRLVNLREQSRDAKAPATKSKEKPPPRPSAAMLETWDGLGRVFFFVVIVAFG